MADKLTAAQAEALNFYTSEVLDRMRFARRAGLQYGDKRDVYEVAGYPSVTDLEGVDAFDYFWDRYERDEIAGRIVDLAPATCWSKPPRMGEPDMDDGTQLTEAFHGLADRIGLWRHMERIDKLSRIGRYGALLIGVRGDGDDAALQNEMPRMSGPDDVLYLSPFTERHARIKEYDGDPASPRYGLPMFYELDLSIGLTTQQRNPQQAMVTVHHSRILHVAEGLLEDDVFGRPALKRVFNRLLDLEKVAASTGEGFWQLASRILTAELDPKAEASDATIAAMGEALEEIMHDLRRQFIGQGAKLEWMGGDPVDPSGAAKMYQQLIAAGANIPTRILFGSETGERASSEDMKQWLGFCAGRQEIHCEPNLVRAFADRMIEYGALPEPTTGGYYLDWPALFTENEKEIAERNKILTDAAKALTPIGGDPGELVTIDDMGNVQLRPTVDGPAVNAANQTDFPTQGDDETISLSNSAYNLPPLDYIARIREEYPDIWARGGNIEGNRSDRILTEIRENDIAADDLSVAQRDKIREREAWSARHFENNRLPGVIAQLKWHMVGSRGFDFMRGVIQDAIDRSE